MLETAEKEGFLKTPHQKTIIRAVNSSQMLDLIIKIDFFTGKLKTW
jgi:hypothetical protein